MKIEKKRACALEAIRRIRLLLKVERDVDREILAEKKRIKRVKPKKVAHCPPIKLKMALPQRKKPMKVRVVCATCHQPIFKNPNVSGGMKNGSGEVCTCREPNYFGKFLETKKEPASPDASEEMVNQAQEPSSTVSGGQSSPVPTVDKKNQSSNPPEISTMMVLRSHKAKMLNSIS